MSSFLRGAVAVRSGLVPDRISRLWWQEWFGLRMSPTGLEGVMFKIGEIGMTFDRHGLAREGIQSGGTVDPAVQFYIGAIENALVILLILSIVYAVVLIRA